MSARQRLASVRWRTDGPRGPREIAHILRHALPARPTHPARRQRARVRCRAGSGRRPGCVRRRAGFAGGLPGGHATRQRPGLRRGATHGAHARGAAELAPATRHAHAGSGSGRRHGHRARPGLRHRAGQRTHGDRGPPAHLAIALAPGLATAHRCAVRLAGQGPGRTRHRRRALWHGGRWQRGAAQHQDARGPDPGAIARIRPVRLDAGKRHRIGVRGHRRDPGGDARQAAAGHPRASRASDSNRTTR